MYKYFLRKLIFVLDCTTAMAELVICPAIDGLIALLSDCC